MYLPSPTKTRARRPRDDWAMPSSPPTSLDSPERFFIFSVFLFYFQRVLGARRRRNAEGATDPFGRSGGLPSETVSGVRGIF